jgi:hypothetical protein
MDGFDCLQTTDSQASNRRTFEVSKPAVVAATDGHGNRRRNSTGTIYVATTMSTQDNEATIKCVCVVIRAHMMEAAKYNITPERKFDVFKTVPEDAKSSGTGAGQV